MAVEIVGLNSHKAVQWETFRWWDYINAIYAALEIFSAFMQSTKHPNITITDTWMKCSIKTSLIH